MAETVPKRDVVAVDAASHLPRWEAQTDAVLAVPAS